MLRARRAGRVDGSTRWRADLGLRALRGAFHESRRPSGRLTGMDPTLGASFVEPFLGDPQLVVGVRGAFGGGDRRSLHPRLELGANRLVAQPSRLVLTVPLDLTLDVRHDASSSVPKSLGTHAE